MNVQQFYQRLAQVRGQLATQFPAEVSSVFLVSLPSDDGGRAGEVTEAARELAAQCLAKRTHRIAEQSEIDDFYLRQQDRAKKYAQEEMRNQKQSVVVISPESLYGTNAGAAVQQLAAQSSAAGEKGRAQTKG